MNTRSLRNRRHRHFGPITIGAIARYLYSLNIDLFIFFQSKTAKWFKILIIGFVGSIGSNRRFHRVLSNDGSWGHRHPSLSNDAIIKLQQRIFKCSIAIRSHRHNACCIEFHGFDTLCDHWWNTPAINGTRNNDFIAWRKTGTFEIWTRQINQPPNAT